MVLKFDIVAPNPRGFRLEQADSMSGVRTVVATVPDIDNPGAEVFTYDPATGAATWDVPIDGTKWYFLVSISLVGTEAEAHLPPQPSQPGTWLLYAHTVDAGLGVKAGAQLSVDCVAAVGLVGEKSIVLEKSGLSDVNGYVALTIPADAGDYTAKLGAVTKTFSTAGRSGTAVNWATL
jgi:hypothetical protein